MAHAIGVMDTEAWRSITPTQWSNNEAPTQWSNKEALESITATQVGHTGASDSITQNRGAKKLCEFITLGGEGCPSI